MSKDIKKKADSFVKKQKLTTIDYPALKNTAVKMGYTIIEFNSAFNEEDVETVLRNLNLLEATKQSRGFTYVNKDHRLIFINEDLNDEEKLLVLSHEMGHIVCGHFATAPIIGKDVKDEYEANEFSHHLLNQSIFQKTGKFIRVHRKGFITAVVILCVMLASLATFALMKSEEVYADNLYITSTGKCYHKKDCIFVKNKINSEKLTVEAFESGEYTPCDMCLPDEN